MVCLMAASSSLWLLFSRCNWFTSSSASASFLRNSAGIVGGVEGGLETVLSALGGGEGRNSTCREASSSSSASFFYCCSTRFDKYTFLDWGWRQSCQHWGV